MARRRRARTFIAGLFGLVLVAVVGVALVLSATLPSRTGTVRLPGLRARADVAFDRWGIPYITAADDRDAAEALGYVQAGDRMVQMDLMRRAAAGELSELIGPTGLPLDETARILGTRHAAEIALRGASPRTRDLLEAYSRGVNAYLAARGRFAAPEYLALGPPRPWAPIDSLLWAETMGLALSDNLDLELERLALSPHLSRDAILALWPTGHPAPADQASLLASPALAELARATAKALPRFPSPYTLPDTASNEWAVDGRHTASGAPLLAGDPHLSYGVPCLWYLARITTPDGSMAGATAPGTPYVVIGHNRRIAWTFTTTGADTEDLFVEKTVDADHYASPGGPLAFGHRVERIHVRGRPDVVIDVRSTRHGPVISDLGRLFGIATPEAGMVIAADIASLAPDNTAADGLDRLDHAGSADEAVGLAPVLSSPVQNLLIADSKTIALATTGRVPIRKSGDGSMAVPGWDGVHDWTGFAAGADLPQLVAPASGVLVNANEPVIGTPSRVFMGRDNYAAWRSQRIQTLLDRPDHRFVPDDFVAMQGDVSSAYVRSLLPVFRAVRPSDATARAAIGLLAHWDGSMDADSPQPLIVEAWLSEIRQALAHAAHDDDGIGIAPFTFVHDALTSTGPGSICAGDCGPMLAATLSQGLARLTPLYGNDPGIWRWGNAHHAVFTNPLWNSIPVLSGLVKAAPSVGGDGSTVDAQGVAAGKPGFDSVHGAAFRGVYDLSDLDRSRFVIATGQSGNPLSGHLLDFVPIWKRVATVTIPAQPDQTAQHMVFETPVAP